MKILMILSNPFIVDPRVYKEAKSLVDAGHEVTVIVWDRKRDYDPESAVDGIKIIRIHNEGRSTSWYEEKYISSLIQNLITFMGTHAKDYKGNIRNLMKEHIGTFVEFSILRPLVSFFGDNFWTAHVFSQLLYWSDRGSRRDHFIFKTMMVIVVVK